MPISTVSPTFNRVRSTSAGTFTVVTWPRALLKVTERAGWLTATTVASPSVYSSAISAGSLGAVVDDVAGGEELEFPLWPQAANGNSDAPMAPATR